MYYLCVPLQLHTPILHIPLLFPPSASSLPVTPTIPPRRKRQAGSVIGLTVEWLTNSHASLRWRHSSQEPPEDTYYSVLHVAVAVIGGRTTIAYQFFTVSHQTTSFTLRDVSTNHFNIFSVTTATPSEIHTSIAMRGKYLGVRCPASLDNSI